LFQSFLEAVGGKHPKSIMTDQDAAMRVAISQIFPQANHRNCVFHIKYKAEIKCGRCMDKKDGLREELSRAL
jgi:transposase-like protein